MPLRACSFRFLSSPRRVLVAPSMRSVACPLLTFLLVSSVASAVEDPLIDAPPTYRDAMYAVMCSFTSRDLEGARAQVQKADSGYQQTPVSLNILGAVAIEQKKFEEGRQFCLQALHRDTRLDRKSGVV